MRENTTFSSTSPTSISPSKISALRKYSPFVTPLTSPLRQKYSALSSLYPRLRSIKMTCPRMMDFIVASGRRYSPQGRIRSAGRLFPPSASIRRPPLFFAFGSTPRFPVLVVFFHTPCSNAFPYIHAISVSAFSAERQVSFWPSGHGPVSWPVRRQRPCHPRCLTPNPR